MNGEQRGAVTVGHPRDPQLAEMFGGGRTLGGVSVSPTSSMRHSAVYASVGLLSDAIGGLPWEILLKDVGTGGETRATDHPLWPLLHDAPNLEQTSIEFRQDQVCHLALRGNAYTAIVQNPGTGAIEALWPMHPDRTRPFRYKDGQGVTRVAYDFMPLNGPSMVLTDAEVIHLKRRPFSHDGLRGTSPIDLHRQTIGGAIAADEYGAAVFGNNAQPNGAVTVPGGARISPEARDMLRESWDEKHRGPRNAARIAILDAGMSFQQIGMTNEQAQYIDSRRYSAVEIARLFGVPPHLIGETDKSTSWGSGIEQLSIAFVVYCLRPWLVLFEQGFKRRLLLPRERTNYTIEMNIDGLLRGDFKTRMDGFATMIQWSIAAPNEIRRLLNLPAMAGGDDRLQPLNMVEASRALEVLLATRTPTGQRAISALAELAAGGNERAREILAEINPERSAA